MPSRHIGIEAHDIRLKRVVRFDKGITILSEA
jgi:hypothetical protein